MTTMFFAGIPLEGSGARPLEADLYGAEKQGVDHENLSATGNLNVGVVVDYDEHAQHYLNGGGRDDNQGLNGFGGTARPISAIFAAAESTGYHGNNFGGDNNSFMQTTTQATPSSQTIDLPTRADNPDSVSSYSNAAQSSGSTSGNSHSSNTSNSESTFESHSNSSGNTYNTYDTTINKTTTDEYNISENNCNYVQNGGNTYIENGGEHCGPGEGCVPNLFNSFVISELHFANTVTNEIVTTVNQTLSSADTTITDLTGGINGVLNTVDIALNTAGNSVTQIISIVDSVENTTHGFLADITNTVDHFSGGIEGTLLSVAEPIITIEGNLSNGNTINILSHDTGSLVIPMTNNFVDFTTDILNVTGNTLSAPIDILSNDSLSPGEMNSDIHNIFQGSGNLTHDILSLAGGVTDNTLSGLNLPPLLDANVSVLTQNLPQASGSLINITGSLLGESGNSAVAGTSGFLNADVSLLSNTSGSHAADGISLSLNPEALAPFVPAAGGINVVPEITIPLPSASSSVPIVSHVAGAVTDIGNTLNDATGNHFDSIATLTALTQTSNVAAVDGGVLFTGNSAAVGHDSSTGSSSPTGSHDVLHVGNLMHATLLGMH